MSYVHWRNNGFSSIRTQVTFEAEAMHRRERLELRTSMNKAESPMTRALSDERKYVLLEGELAYLSYSGLAASR